MKKIWNIVGAAIGVVVIIMGIVFAATPANTYSTDSADTASFGADFYTYQYKATKIVAQNAAVTANNLREVGEKMALYAGMAFIVAGLLITLHFVKELTSMPKAAPQFVAVQPSPVPVQPQVTTVQPMPVQPAPAQAEEVKPEEVKLPEI